MSVNDLSKVGLLRTKVYSDATLKAMRKSELISYIRVLEKNYDDAIFFNERQAKNIEKMLKDRGVTE